MKICPFFATDLPRRRWLDVEAEAARARGHGALGSTVSSGLSSSLALAFLSGGWSEALYLKPGTRIIPLDGVDPETFMAGGCSLPTALHGIDRADILMGDTVLAAYESFDRLTETQAFASFLFTIARRNPVETVPLEHRRMEEPKR